MNFNMVRRKRVKIVCSTSDKKYTKLSVLELLVNDYTMITQRLLIKLVEWCSETALNSPHTSDRQGHHSTLTFFVRNVK